MGDATLSTSPRFEFRIDSAFLSASHALAGARSIDIEVDGGITAETAPLVARAGANVLVAGSAVFKGGKGDNYRANIAAIRNAAAFARGEAA